MFQYEWFVEYLGTLHANYVLVKDLFHLLENHILNWKQRLESDSAVPLLQAPRS